MNKEDELIEKYISNMNTTNELFSFLDCYYDDTMDEIISELKEMELLKANDDYMRWLIEFKKIHPDYFNGYEVLNYQLCNIDKENIKKISLFYNVIFKYAIKNYIYPDIYENGELFKIKYKDKGYYIGVVNDNCFYMECINIDKDKQYIDFNDIIDDKKLERARDIDNKIAKINYLIDTIHGAGVSVENIRRILDNYLNSIDNTTNDIKNNKIKIREK